MNDDSDTFTFQNDGNTLTLNKLSKQHPIEHLSKGSNLIMDLNKLSEISNRANNDRQSILIDLLNSKPIFKNGKLEEIENDIGIVYALRNSATHKIRDRPSIHQYFNNIVDRLFNVFFLVIEKLFIGTTT